MSRVVYKLGVTKQAATLAEHGPGLQTGHVRYENGREYVLVQASVAIPDGQVCTLPLAATAVTGAAAVALVLRVAVAGGPTEVAFCANNTGAAITDEFFFWGIQKGRGYGLGGTIGDGVDFTPGAAGIIQANAGATGEVAGVAISDVTTDLLNAVWWAMPSKGAVA